MLDVVEEEEEEEESISSLRSWRSLAKRSREGGVERLRVVGWMVADVDVDVGDWRPVAATTSRLPGVKGVASGFRVGKVLLGLVLGVAIWINEWMSRCKRRREEYVRSEERTGYSPAFPYPIGQHHFLRESKYPIHQRVRSPLPLCEQLLSFVQREPIHKSRNREEACPRYLESQCWHPS